MASWEKNTSSVWPTWSENKLFTVLLAILMVYSIVWVGVHMKKTMREFVHVGFSDLAAPTISVSATGTASVVPDIAVIDFTVTKIADTAASAQSETAEIMNAVLAAMKALNIADADVQTSTFSTSEVYDYDVSPAEITGHQSTQTLTVKIRDANIISAVLDAGPKNGATSVSGIRYDVDDDTAVLALARSAAVVKAEVQARAIAVSLHQHLGRVVSYSESTGGMYPMAYGMTDSAKAGAPTVAPEIAIGEQETQIVVYITYAIN